MTRGRRIGIGIGIAVLVIGTGAFFALRNLPHTSRQTPYTGQPTAEATSYLKEVALGTEYGGGEQRIAKWTKSEVSVGLWGNISEGENTCASTVMNDFNALSSEVQLVPAVAPFADIQIHVIPQSQFSLTLPEYVAGNKGYFYMWWDESRAIYKATVLIDSEDDITDAERCHLMREELTQSMGLAQDSTRYPDSIFQSDWTDVTSYADIDKSVIHLLYGGYGIAPGDDAAAIDTKIRSIDR